MGLPASRCPGLWWADESGRNDRKFTFAQLARSARQAANFFTSLGIRRGDNVMLILPRVPPWWVAMLGLIRIGAVPVPGTPLLTPKDIRYRSGVASIRALITDPAGAAKIEAFDGIRILVGASLPEWTSLDDGLAQASTAHDFIPTLSHEPGIIYFTSGTAGDAKMVLHSQASYGLGHVITGKYWLDLGPDDIIWALADTGWGKTAWSSFFGPWLQGAAVFSLDIRDKFDASVILKTLARFPISVFCAPATALRLIVRQDLSAYSFPHLRHCVASGKRSIPRSSTSGSRPPA